MATIDEKIEELKQLIRKTSPDQLQSSLYSCVSNTCTLLTSFLQMKGAPGWSSRLVDSAEEPMLSSEEQIKLETAFASAPWILDFLTPNTSESQSTQSGGGPMPPLSVAGSQLLDPSSLPTLTGEDVSLDAAFQKFLDKSNEMDEYWNTFAYASPGVSKLLNTDFTVTIPFTPPIPVPVPLRPVVYLIIAILDSIRLSKAIAGTQTNLLTLLVFIEELLTGQWRQMILTAAGFISPSGVALGVIFKYIVNAWMLVNPALRDTILKDMYKGSKSLFIGFLLWIGSTLPPNVVKAPLQASFDQIQNLVSGLEEKVKEIEEQASTTLAPVGKKLKFKDLKLNTLSRISLQDIQNLQTLAQWKVITCSAEFDDIMKPLTQIPIFRFIIELLGIPTIPTDKFEACGAPPYKSIAEVASEAFTPEIIDTLPTLSLPTVPQIPTLPVPVPAPEGPLAAAAPAAAAAAAAAPTESVESKSTNVDSTPPKKQSGGSKRRKSKSKSKASKSKSKRLTRRRSSRTR